MNHEQAKAAILAREADARQKTLGEKIWRYLFNNEKGSMVADDAGEWCHASHIDHLLARIAELEAYQSQWEPVSENTKYKRIKWLESIQAAIKSSVPKHVRHQLEQTAKGIESSIKFGGTKRLREEVARLEAQVAKQQIQLDAFTSVARKRAEGYAARMHGGVLNHQCMDEVCQIAVSLIADEADD